VEAAAALLARLVKNPRRAELIKWVWDCITLS
jgi:hypothetical protein